MLHDVRAGRMTEVVYINGYIVKRGTYHDIYYRPKRTIVQMVQEKQM